MTIKCKVKDFGRQGATGEPGKDGSSLFMGAPYDTLELLKEAVPTGQQGELHVIGGIAVYGWDEPTQSWIFTGPWGGAQIAPDFQELIANMVATLSASNVAVGSVLPSASIKELPGQKWFNGQTLTNAADNYFELLEYVLSKGKYVTMEEYSSRLVADGQCAVYGWNGTDLRLPKINRPIAGEYIADNVGNISPDTMRRITGQFNPQADNQDLQAQGCFKNLGGHHHGSGKGDNDNPLIAFDSGLLGPAYAGSETRGKQVLWPYSVIYTTKLQQNQSVPNYVYRASDQSSTPDTVAISIGGGFQTLPNNTLLLIKIKNTNTGPAALVINGGSPIPILLSDEPLPAQTLAAGKRYSFIFNQPANTLDFEALLTAEISVNKPKTINCIMTEAFSQITLDEAVPAKDYISVNIDGQAMQKINYSLSADGKTITFNEEQPISDSGSTNVEISYFTAISVPEQLSGGTATEINAAGSINVKTDGETTGTDSNNKLVVLPGAKKITINPLQDNPSASSNTFKLQTDPSGRSAYKATLSQDSTFIMPSEIDEKIVNQIQIYMLISGTAPVINFYESDGESAIAWESDEMPNWAAAIGYRIVLERNPINGKWVGACSFYTM